MIICPNCGRENEDHYKFCLGCGTEISKDDTPVPVAAPTALPRVSATPAPVSAPPEAVPPAPTFEPDFPSGSPLVASPEEAETMDRPLDDSLDADRSIDDGPPDDEDDPAQRPTLLSSPAVPEPVQPAVAEPVQPAVAEPVQPAVAEPVQPAVAEPVHQTSDDRTDPLGFENTADALGAVVDEDLPFVPPSGHTPAPEEIAQAFAAVGRQESAVEPADSGTPTLFTPRPATAGPSRDGAGAAAPLAQTPSPVASPSRDCKSCSAVVPEGFKFCGVCGARYDDTPAEDVAPPAEPGGALLVLVHPDGTDGESFQLEGEVTTVGRTRPEPLFAQDPFLSPEHATFYFAKGQLFVRDEASLNGIFLRIKAEVELFHNDQFRVGQQLLRFEEMSQVRPVVPGAGDGTTVMGSPVRGCWGRLASVVGIDTVANVWPLRKAETYIGRERGELRFPEDGFVSGNHANVSSRDGRFFLADLDSTNGTYLRIKGEGLLNSGDLLLLGQQLFRIELG